MIRFLCIFMYVLRIFIFMFYIPKTRIFENIELLPHQSPLAPDLKTEVGLTFYHSINEIVKSHNIPPEMIINIDQTPIPFVLISKYTLDKRDPSRISVPGTADYRPITGTFGITMAGDFLPPQLIYQGKKYNFPKEFHLTQTPNHWANEKTSVDFLELVLITYIEKQRKDLNLSCPWLLISDVFKAQ